MTTFDRIDAALPELIDELAAPTRPRLLRRHAPATAATRQRPAWSALERWLPMGVDRPRVPSDRAWRSSRSPHSRSPGWPRSCSPTSARGSTCRPPFGPAARRRPLLRHSRRRHRPRRPGRRATTPHRDRARRRQRACCRPATASGSCSPASRQGMSQFVVAGPGRLERPRLARHLPEFTWVDWSPDGNQIASSSTIHGVPSISVIQTDGSGVTTLPLGLETTNSGGCRPGRSSSRAATSCRTRPRSGPYIVNADGDRPGPIGNSREGSTRTCSGISPCRPMGSRSSITTGRDPEPGRLYRARHRGPATTGPSWSLTSLRTRTRMCAVLARRPKHPIRPLESRATTGRRAVPGDRPSTSGTRGRSPGGIGEATGPRRGQVHSSIRDSTHRGPALVLDPTEGQDRQLDCRWTYPTAAAPGAVGSRSARRSSAAPCSHGGWGATPRTHRATGGRAGRGGGRCSRDRRRSCLPRHSRVRQMPHGRRRRYWSALASAASIAAARSAPATPRGSLPFGQ